MIPSLLYSLVFFFLFNTNFIRAQFSTGSGYIGYNLTCFGDPPSAIYSTSSTPANISTTVPEPDVYLNASVHVGEIDITVSNLTAKINLDARVLNLLKFNAGVDASIDRVSLLIQNVDAEVLLEARLANLVLMINDVLKSLDLNPVLATLGQDLGSIITTTVGGLTGGTPLASRSAPLSYILAHNILYSINDYSGHTHTNRVLTQSGSIIDQSLDDNGNIDKQQLVGSYLGDMTFNGHNHSVVMDGQAVRELEYVYTPFYGLDVVSAIYINATGTVVATQVLSESGGGGSSTIGDLAQLKAAAAQVPRRIWTLGATALERLSRTEVSVPGLGQVSFDVAFGGAFYAVVEAEPLQVGLTLQHYITLIDYGRRIKRAILENFKIEHPFEADLSSLFGVIFTGPANAPNHHSRNVTVYEDGEVDRSSTGTGVSARAALAFAKGEIAIVRNLDD
ncbi:hypothetical protein BZG36_05548 [Bifiguratus adelaidae]|uniref:trans-L-3-hydroxyproline dehydratase n=1 Tax=Bifiguratus adelaidae TaxID=1938954 RepID=A0A261XUK5_9FUNG|nr:hypothetical protein BZG36_05548 [Bifiguratus adelaidae]